MCVIRVRAPCRNTAQICFMVLSARYVGYTPKELFPLPSTEKIAHSHSKTSFAVFFFLDIVTIIAADDSTNETQSDLNVTVDSPVSRKNGIDIPR